MGITLDSLAHNLTLYSSGDVVPQWYTTLQKDLSDRGHSFNLLIVPWPEFISPTQFSPATPQNGELDNMPESYGFFCFNKESNPKELISRLDSLHEKAIKTVGPIHMVVLPELALDPVEYDQVRLWARRKELLLLCGVG